MPRKRKFAKSIQQEGISRDQISERLKEFGWIPSPTSIDLGEDFIVHIYIDGNPTGKTFHLQAKSVTNIDERRKKNSLVYKFKTQDIYDWEQFEDPVILLVWDIKQRAGKWALLEDVVRYLDNNNPEWRKNKSTVNVFIPWINSTDDKGLLGLRERIAVSMLPILLNKKDFSIQLKEEEVDLEKVLQSLSTSGGSFTTSGAHFNFPKWFIKWFDPNNFTLIFEAKLPQEPIYFKMIAVDLDGQSLHHETELIMKHRDDARITFSNDHLKAPIHVEFELLKNTNNKQYDYYTNISVNNFGKTIYENRDILLFLRAFISGSKRNMVLANKEGESNVLEGDNKKGVFPEDLNNVLSILNKLCKIQDHTSQPIVYPTDGFANKDLQAIERLYQAIDRGKVNVKSSKFEIEFLKQGLNILLANPEGNENIDAKFQMGIDSHFTLFGKDIQLGRLVRFISGKLDQSKSQLTEIANNLGEEGSFEVSIQRPQVIDLYLDLLIKEAGRVAGLLHRNYSTISVVMIGDLVWGERLFTSTQIELVLDSINDISEVEAYCKSITNYPIRLYKLNELSDEVQRKVQKSGTVL